MAYSKAVVDRNLQLVEPSIWSNFEAFFLIAAEQLPAEVGSIGDFDILHGSLQEPVFYAGVRPLDRGRRVLVISMSANGSPLTSCAPPPGGARPMLGGYSAEPCSEVQIRSKDDSLWGTLVAQEGDLYSVLRGAERVMTMEGDQEAGRLVVYLDGEPVAHAARSHGSNRLEVGVKPRIDPVLMLTCILAVVIFNPEALV